MNDQTPPTLDRLWEELPVGPAPVDSLVAAGRTARRRRRRTVFAGVAAATVLVIGGVAVGTQFVGVPAGPGPGPATSGPGAESGLSATVGLAPREDVTVRGVAEWDEQAQTMAYFSFEGYSSSCLPEVRASLRDGVLDLALDPTSSGAQACTADSRAVMVTVTGLTGRPDRVDVTEYGERRDVRIQESGADSRKPDRPLPLEVVVDSENPVDADLERLARELVAYALEARDTVPVWESVTFALGGERAQSVDDMEAALATRSIWSFCPADWSVYGASSCPVDALGMIASARTNGTSLVLSADPGEVTCAPARTGAYPRGRLVAIRPEAASRTCAEDFSLVLAANDDGQLTAVDLTLSAP